MTAITDTPDRTDRLPARLARPLTRRGVLKAGLATASVALAGQAMHGAAWAQDATPAASPAALVPLTDEERGLLAGASRIDVNGWVHVKVQGAPFARGFQHGYLIAAEYAAAVRVYAAMTLETTGFEYAFFVQKAAELHKAKITPELLDEMNGLAAGFTKAGVPTTLDEIIGWNA